MDWVMLRKTQAPGAAVAGAGTQVASSQAQPSLRDGIFAWATLTVDWKSTVTRDRRWAAKCARQLG